MGLGSVLLRGWGGRFCKKMRGFLTISGSYAVGCECNLDRALEVEIFLEEG